MSFWSPIIFPNLTIPIEGRRNPHVEDVKASIWTWVRTFDLIHSTAARKEFTSTQVWELTARCFPDASAEDLCIIGDWLTFMHIQSAQFAEARVGRLARRHQAYVDVAIRLMHTPRIIMARHDGVLLAALNELWMRTQQRMTPEMSARFVGAFSSYLTGYLAAAENRRLDFLPTLGEYVTMRRNTSGFQLFALLAEMAHQETLPPNLFDFPGISVLYHHANDAVSWMHDLYRMERFASRNDQHHIVAVIRQEKRLLPQEAVDEVGERINAVVRDFSHRYRAMMAAPNAAAPYAESIASIMRGMYDWLRTQGWLAGTQVHRGEAQEPPAPLS